MRIEPRPFDDPVGAVLRAELEAEVVVRHADCQDSICFERALR